MSANKSDESKLVSMKLPKEKKGAEKMYPSMESPEYPWGLQLRLENEQLEKLGIKDLPKVGTKLTIVAHVEVCSTGEYESQDGAPQRNIALQVTELGLE